MNPFAQFLLAFYVIMILAGGIAIWLHLDTYFNRQAKKKFSWPENQAVRRNGKIIAVITLLLYTALAALAGWGIFSS